MERAYSELTIKEEIGRGSFGCVLPLKQVVSFWFRFVSQTIGSRFVHQSPQFAIPVLVSRASYTKLHHGDPDVQITLTSKILSSDYKAIERDISFILILSSIGQFSIPRSRKLSARLLWKGKGNSCNTIQASGCWQICQVTFQYNIKVKLSTQWSFKMAENHYMPQTKVDWTCNNASSLFKLWRKEVERIIGAPLASRSDRVKMNHIYIWAAAHAKSLIEAKFN